MRINRENSIGLVIDMQEKLIPTVAQQEEIVRNTIVLLKGLKVLEIPIVVTQQNTKALGQTVKEINNVIGNFSYIEKMAFSCYREPAFIKVLHRLSKRNVIIVGAEAHVCVLQTSLDLLYNNYNPVIVEDCIASYSENDKRVALWRMRDVGSIVTTTETILFELCRESGTEEFKNILDLIKIRRNA
jgi:nicotinamidase-related amidase